MEKFPLAEICRNTKYAITTTWKREKILIIFIVLQALIGLVLPFVSIYLPSVILSGVTYEISFQTMLLRVVILAALLAAGGFVNSYIGSVSESYLTNNKMFFLTSVLRKKMAMSYQEIESSEGQNKFQNVMGILFNDGMGISGLLTNLGAFLGLLLSFSLYTGIISLLNPLIVVFLLVSSLLHFYVLKRLMDYEYENREKWVVLDKKLNYVFSRIMDHKYGKDIKLFSMQKWLGSIIKALIRDRLAWTAVISRKNFKAVIVDVIILIIRDLLSYYFIFRAVLDGQIQIAEFTLYFGAITGFSVFVTSILQGIIKINRNSQDISIIRDYLGDSLDKTQQISAPHCDVPASSHIEFEHVTFGYHDDYKILDDISLSIRKGEKIALVGENGAGKTTFVKLLCGLYRPVSGKVCIDGLPTSDIDDESVYKHFSVVFQDVFVLPMTVAENISLADLEHSDLEKIKACMALSGLDETVSDMNLPLTKIMNKNGVELSGGEVQKLMLARAIYKQSDILILDEPTSALDPIAEEKMYMRYAEILHDKSSIFISHRLASTQFCDRILFLEHGKIVEMGTHQELMGLKKKYYDLYELQSQYYKS